MSSFCITFLFLLTSLRVNVTRRVYSSSIFSTKAPHTRRTRNNTACLTLLYTQLASFLPPTTCRARNHPKNGVISCSASFLQRRPPTHYHMPMKSHPRRCDFSLGIFLPPTHAEHERVGTTPSFVVEVFSSSTCQARNHTSRM